MVNTMHDHTHFSPFRAIKIRTCGSCNSSPCSREMCRRTSYTLQNRALHPSSGHPNRRSTAASPVTCLPRSSCFVVNGREYEAICRSRFDLWA